jgi:cytochrome d ubiquinol oxidase subunit II
MFDTIAPHLPLILALIIATAVTFYVLLDGFDLGIGILFLFAPSEADRRRMINTIAPIWDGNETWLVLGGGGLLAAFPVAYSVLLPAFYMPIMIMLLALVFRGVAFEFHAKATKHKYIWNLSFSIGSIVATFSQGVVLGAFIEGVKISGDHYATFQYAGDHFDWLSPFTLFCGMALICGYALLGSCWLVKKTEGPLQKWAGSMGRLLLFVVSIFIGGVSILTPIQEPEIYRRWFEANHFVMLLPVPIITFYCICRCWISLGNSMIGKGKDYAPYLYTSAIFILSFFGLGISFWPYLVPYQITIWQAAAAPNSQFFILIGVVLILPVILLYTGFVYKVFWGKTTDDMHHY